MRMWGAVRSAGPWDKIDARSSPARKAVKKIKNGVGDIPIATFLVGSSVDPIRHFARRETASYMFYPWS